jgi:hypothetical protein
MLQRLLTPVAIVGVVATLGTLALAREATRPFDDAGARTTAIVHPREVMIPAGTVLRVRLENGVGSDYSRVEDPVRGRLVNDIAVGDHVVVPAGSLVLGSITQSVRSGKVKGRARIAMRFHTVAPAGSAERYRISTRTWARVAPGTKKKDALIIGAPAGGGAIVGGLVGGKKGAAVGAAAGGGAGTAVVLSTRGREVRLPRGSVVAVRLSAPAAVQVD